MKRILHIGNDDRFICPGKKIFDAIPDATNDYWIIPRDSDLEYVDFQVKNLAGIDLNSTEYFQDINSYDLICIHFLHPKLYSILESGKIKKPILWIGWGGDYYWLLDTYKNFDLFLPKTCKHLKGIFAHPSFETLIKQLKKIKRKSKLKAVNQIQYFAPTNFHEYELLKNNYPSFKPQYFDWNYGYIDETVTNYYSSLKSKGNKTMIGNSATPTNNHLDIIHDLKSILQDRELVIPLNYGDPEYARFIEKEAITELGNGVEALDKTLPSQEFDKVLVSCKNLIIGSQRQQAIGTIITALYLGINVFLYQEGLNYLYFKQQNFHIYSIEELKENPSLLEFKISEDKIKENQQKIVDIWSLKRNKNSLIQLLNSLT